MKWTTNIQNNKEKKEKKKSMKSDNNTTATNTMSDKTIAGINITKSIRDTIKCGERRYGRHMDAINNEEI